jgi:hypothetical protein
MKIRIHAIVSTLTVCSLLCLSGGCGQKSLSGNPGSSAVPANKAGELAALQEKRQGYEARLKAMSAADLVQRLAADSAKGREPFNSATYRELVSRGASAGAAIKAQLGPEGHADLLNLLALRPVDPGQYHALDPAFRVKLLVDALKNAKFFNAWGIPHLYWEDAARAIIDEGPAASDALSALLRDTRPAPVFGSEGAVVDQQYHYRVRDYAWALLAAARNQKIDIPADPAARDRLIGP